VGIVESQALSELRAAREMLGELGAGGSVAFNRASRALRGIERHLARPVRIAVLGEGNSGKSLFLNYLLRHQILPTSQFSPDETEILIRFAEEPSVYVVNRDGRRTRLTSRANSPMFRPQAAPSSNGWRARLFQG